MPIPPNFDATFQRAKPGETVVYFRGNLGLEREQEARANRGSLRWTSAEINNVANSMWNLSVRGFGFLTQKRIGPEECEYRITMRRTI